MSCPGEERLKLSPHWSPSSVTCGADVAPAATNFTRKGCGGSVKRCQAHQLPTSKASWCPEPSGSWRPSRIPLKQCCALERGSEESWLVNGNIFNFPGLLDDGSCSISPFLSSLDILLSFTLQFSFCRNHKLTCTLGMARQ